jgi:hypothetical protein
LSLKISLKSRHPCKLWCKWTEETSIHADQCLKVFQQLTGIDDSCLGINCEAHCFVRISAPMATELELNIHFESPRFAH